jgi:hypothetical protein
MFRSLLYDHPQASYFVLSAFTTFRLLASSFAFSVCGGMPSVSGVAVCGLSGRERIIQTQRTQISGRNSNGPKHSGGPPEDGREKRPKHVGVLYLQTRF